MTKFENNLRNFIDETEVKKIMTDCIWTGQGYQMSEMFKITVREVGQGKNPEMEITISSNCKNGVSEYTRTYKI